MNEGGHRVASGPSEASEEPLPIRMEERIRIVRLQNLRLGSIHVWSRSKRFLLKKSCPAMRWVDNVLIRKIAVFIHTQQEVAIAHDQFLQNLFSSSSVASDLPEDFPRAIRQVLTTPFPTEESELMELADQALRLGLASREILFMTLILRMRRECLVHASAGIAEVSDRDSTVDPSQAAEAWVSMLLHASRQLFQSTSPGLHIVGEDEDGFDLQPVPEELVEVPEFRPMMGSGEPSEDFPEDFDYDGNNTGE
jgi:hypothetical protein